MRDLTCMMCMQSIIFVLGVSYFELLISLRCWSLAVVTVPDPLYGEFR